MMRLGLVIWLFCAAGASLASGELRQGAALSRGELTEATFQEIRASIQPTAAELSWRDAIPWRLTLGEGVAEAREQDRPILLWTAAGQPLGHS